MSPDDTTAGSVFTPPTSMPDASHRNVVLALHAVRVADRTTKITDRWLKSEHHVGQDKQAARLIRFLQLIDTRKKLTEDVLAKRQDWEAFRELLMERVRQACKQIGVEEDRVLRFASGSWDAFQNALLRCAAVASRSDRSQENIIACFQALANVCEMDEHAFETEVASVSARTSDGQCGPSSHKHADHAPTEQELTFPIGRQDRGRIVYARISFSGPMQPGDLRRLAGILQTMDVRTQE